jgi:predicted Zn finger-like uncharacterized protein
MRIVCERCGAPFAVDEARVPETGARAACPRCKNIVVLRRPASTQPPQSLKPETETSAAPTLPPDPLQRDGGTTGDYAVPDALAAAIASAIGRVTGNYTPVEAQTADQQRLAEAMGLSTDPTTPVGAISIPNLGANTPHAGYGFQNSLPSYQPASTSSNPGFAISLPNPMAPSYGGYPTPMPAMNPTPTGFELSDLFPGQGDTNPAFPSLPPPAYSSQPPTPVYVPPITAPPVYVAAAPTPPPIPFTPAPTPLPTPPPGQSTGEILPAELVTGATSALREPTNSGIIEGTNVTSTDELDEWRIKKPEGVVEGPFSSQELMARFEAGLLQPFDLVARANDSFRPLNAYPFTANFSAAKASHRSIRAFASSDRGPFPWKGLFVGLGVFCGALAFAFLIATRPTWLFGKPLSAADATVFAIIESWREKMPPTNSSVQELYQLAKGYYAADTRESYRLAAETFKLVLIKSPRDLKAMSYYAEVRGILAIEDGDPVGAQESAELLDYALRHGTDKASPHVARANLRVATGTASDLLVAQKEADTARQLQPEEPEVLLAVGRAFVATQPEFALEAIEKVQKLDPKLRQIPMLLGQAYVTLGRIAEARQAFETRKRLVPEDVTADLMLAQLDASIGRFDRARSRLAQAGKANAKSIEARLQSTIIRYQIDGDLKGAHEDFKEMLATTLDRKRKLRVCIHAAAVAEELGLFDEAEALIKEGLELDSESAPLLFRTAVLRLTQGRADDAKTAFGKVENLIPDPVQRAILGGRIRAAQGEVDLALGRFSKAMDYSPHDATPFLLAASLYAQIGAQAQTLLMVRKALNADPAWSKSHRAVTEFYDGHSSISVTVGALEALASSQDESALMQAALAVARYHTGDIEGAEKAAKLAIGTDTGALAAHLYLAQISLDRHRPQLALKELESAAKIDHHCPTVSYLTGRAQAQLGRYEEAHGKFREALENDVNFLPALVRDAEVLAQVGQKDEALKLYKKAFKSDPEDLDVRRGLDAIEQGELPPALDVAIEVQNDPESP